MFKYTVKIKQYSPIIHFQSGQYGATLRATELKPKLDKFLIKYAFESTDDYKDLLIKSSSGKEALDYKVHINTVSLPVEVKPVFETKQNSLYFGNMGEGNKNKYFTMQNNNLFDIQIFSYNPLVIEKIKEYFPCFLMVTNFGTRQNKGFGSFYVFDRSPITIARIKELMKKCNKKFLYINYYKNVRITSVNYETILNDVDIIYRLMKSGINFPPIGNFKASYYKGYIYEYMLNQKIGNEKRYIKENFFRPMVRVPSDGMTKKYVRAVLGTFKNLEFKDKDRKGIIEFSNDKFKRYKSPITFKIIDNYLLIIPEDLNAENEEDEIFNKTFKITNEFNGRTTSRFINTPSKNEFVLWDFLISFKEHFNKLEVPSPRNPLERKLKNAKQQTIEVGE